MWYSLENGHDYMASLTISSIQSCEIKGGIDNV